MRRSNVKVTEPVAKAAGRSRLLPQHQLDAIIALSNGPAWLTNLLNRDHFSI